MNTQTIAVIGGTGNLGFALARRWTKAGLKVIIGSRDSASAEAAAQKIGAVGMANADAAAQADIIVLAVPFAAQAQTLEAIAPHAAGKIVVETTVPLVPPKVMQVQLPAEGSAAKRAAAMLPADVRLISAFHNVAAHKLATDEVISGDVLVFGDEPAARAVGIGLAEATGLRGLHGGPLANSAAAEALTSVLIFLNRTYKVDGAGLHITGELIRPHEAS